MDGPPEADAPGEGRERPATGALRPTDWGDAELVARLRAREEAAVRQFYERLAPRLLVEARRAQVQPALCEEVVADVLRAVYESLVRNERRAPDSLAAYAVRALRRRARLVEQLERDAHAPLHQGMQVAESEAVWGHGVAEPDVGAAPPLVQQLAAAVAAALSEDERQVLQWLAEHVPQREIAAWYGVSFGAMRVRILRLREKARTIAARWVTTRPALERVRLNGMLAEAARPPATVPEPGTTRRRVRPAVPPGEVR